MSGAKVVVLGGGLAGLSAAAHLEGQAPLYEQRSSFGGLCRQVRVDGFCFDVVPHVLHFQHASTRAFVSDLLGGRLRSYARQSRVYSHGTFTRYPFQAHLFGLPAAVIEECVQGRVRADRHGGSDTSSFERWVLSTFGPGIAHRFMLPYNAKFWTVPPSELTCEWLDGLIPIPTVQQTIRGALTPDPFEYGYNVQFWYPSEGGLGAVLEALLKGIPRLHLGKRLVRIETLARRLHFADGDVVGYDRLLSSIPLPELRRLLDPCPPKVAQALEALRWTSITVVHLGVRGAPPVSWHWVYVPDRDVSFYRVGIPSQYAPDAAPDGHHILSAEISHVPGRAPDHGRMVAEVIADLQRMGLLRRESDVVVRLPMELRYGYPIYDRHYAWATGVLQRYLKTQGIVVIGRFGSWRYLSMEQTLLDGKHAATAIEKDPALSHVTQ